MISVIIPAYNAADTLPKCLRALQNQTAPADSYEIIVVDDGSTDETAAIAEQFAGVTVLRQVHGGASVARNRGVAASRGALLLFTDADCIPAPDWIAQMQAPFADPEVAGAKGVYQSAQSELTARFVQVEYQSKYDLMRPAESIDFVDTYSAGYRRAVFEDVGGFDPAFLRDEDQELSFRVAEAGYKMVFVPGAVVGHHHDRSPKQYAHRKFLIGYWKRFVVHRHPSKLAKDSHTPQVLKLQMGLAALGGLLAVLGLLLRRRGPFLAAGGAWALLMGSAFPFYRKIWRWDRPVLLVAPALVFLRAWALGLGFLAGSLRLLWLTRVEQADAP